MKVDIGPYRNWFGPYQIAETLLFWMDKEDDRVGNLGDKLARMTWLCKFCEWIDSKKKRKIKVRIDYYDTWSMDNTLAYIILPMLKQLRDTKHGAPYVDDEDVPENLRATFDPKESEFDVDSNHFKRWDWVLEEMIYAFEMELDEDWDLEIYKNGGWNDENIDKRNTIQSRISNGFRLFGKYYQALWD